MYELIKVRPATIKTSPKGRHYIKADRRIYLQSLSHYTSLEDAKTYIFNEDLTKVKRIENLVY